MLFPQAPPADGKVLERPLGEILRRRLHEFSLSEFRCARPGVMRSGRLKSSVRSAVAASKVARERRRLLLLPDD